MGNSIHEVFDLSMKQYRETERRRAFCALVAHKIVNAANDAEDNGNDTIITVYDFDGPESSAVMIVWGVISSRKLNLDFKIRFDFGPLDIDNTDGQITANIDGWIESRGCRYRIGSMENVDGLNPIGRELFARLDAGIRMMEYIIR